MEIESYMENLILGLIIFFTFITILFYYRKDKYGSKPFKMILLAFFLGIFSIIPAIIFSIITIRISSSILILFAIIQSWFTETSSEYAFIIAYDFFSSVAVAPIVEEISKGMFVYALSRSKHFDGPLDGLIYGAMVGAGFAAGENVLYGFGQADLFAGVAVTFIRSVIQITGHPLYTGIVGIGIGLAQRKVNRDQTFSKTYKIYFANLKYAIILHALWNGSSYLSTDFTIGLFIMGIMVVINVIVLLRIVKKNTEFNNYSIESRKNILSREMEFDEEKAFKIKDPKKFA